MHSSHTLLADVTELAVTLASITLCEGKKKGHCALSLGDSRLQVAVVIMGQTANLLIPPTLRLLRHSGAPYLFT